MTGTPNDFDDISLRRRTWSFVDAEVREDGEGMHFRGYAAVFNSDSEPLPFIETIAPGAFRKTLAESKRDIRMYLNHNTDLILGRRRAGTLRLKEDRQGLVVDADLPDTTYARDLSVSMKRGDVDEMSFGFTVPEGKDEWEGNRRRLREISLFEVSVVTGFPAYTATSAHVRKLIEGATVNEPRLRQQLAWYAEHAMSEELESLLLRYDIKAKPEPEAGAHVATTS